MNRCIKCNAKLGSRNGNRNKRNFTKLCVNCYKNPSHQNRCTYTKKDGSRCKLRKSHKSDKYCGIHIKMDSKSRGMRELLNSHNKVYHIGEIVRRERERNG